MLYVPDTEIDVAAAELAKARANGFDACTAGFEPAALDDNHRLRFRFNELYLGATGPDGKVVNWGAGAYKAGWAAVYLNMRVLAGRLVELDAEVPPHWGD